ncbi:MAG: hypothetical protein OHK0013_33320 [Sandaracinaceae bacterium]
MRRIPVGLACIVVASASGCAASTPPFEPSAPDDAYLSEMSDPELDVFCREQATYVYNYARREDATRAFCLSSALQGGGPWPDYGRVTDRASCVAYVETCMTSTRYWPWVSDCDLDYCSNRVSVEQRRRCVTQTVQVTWPTLASELSCDLFGQTERIVEIGRRARPDPRACDAPFCV